MLQSDLIKPNIVDELCFILEIKSIFRNVMLMQDPATIFDDLK